MYETVFVVTIPLNLLPWLNQSIFLNYKFIVTLNLLVKELFNSYNANSFILYIELYKT